MFDLAAAFDLATACDGVSVLLGQRPLSKTFHTHRGWAGSFQSGHASPECDDTKVLPTQMDGSGERACFVLGVSLHYADTFSQCSHFFDAIPKLSSRGVNDSPHRGYFPFMTARQIVSAASLCAGSEGWK